jgi:hypothetical protein
MPLVLEVLDDIKQYISEYTVTPVFYKRDGLNFIILAGKVAWKGNVRTEEEADKIEAFLIERGGHRVKDVMDIEQLFG